MTDRTAQITRSTGETDVEVTLTLDGSGQTRIDTGVGFYDHMLDALGRHGQFDLELACDGDVEIDDHHTVEDCAIGLGRALDEALGDRSGIVRFGSAFAPLDEALARSVVDLSGRPSPHIALDTNRERLGDLSTENAEHALSTLATEAKAAIHVDVLKGENDHHKVEAAFKSLALALKAAVRPTGDDRVRSTKETLQ
jgi:imidazoleglycerol-phosphate dehydratase